MPDYAISDLTEKTEFLSTDLFHLRTVGNIDQKITGANLFSFLIGFQAIQLTNYTGVGKPAIVAGGTVEINGVIYRNSIEVSISGATVNTTWYDILLTPSGTTFTASFVARETGVWSDSKQGLYDSDNRVIACAYRNTSDADWINKNILVVVNRTCKVKMEVGDWDMNATQSVTVIHGLENYFANMRSIKVIIRSDSGGTLHMHDLYQFADAADPTLISGGVRDMLPTSSTGIVLRRRTGGAFDGTVFDETSYNRGWVTLEYEV